MKKQKVFIIILIILTLASSYAAVYASSALYATRSYLQVTEALPKFEEIEGVDIVTLKEDWIALNNNYVLYSPDESRLSNFVRWVLTPFTYFEYSKEVKYFTSPEHLKIYVEDANE